MIDLRNETASTAGGGSVDQGGGPEATKQQKKTQWCDQQSINKKMEEIRVAGLRLRSTSGDTQLATLPKVLAYFGTAGANTYELTAMGYCRAATRIKELKDVYVIDSVREDVIGPDGMFHKNVARYILRGTRKDMEPIQQPLDLEAA
jgi:hypothetical protein